MNLLRKILGLQFLRKYLPAQDLAITLEGNNVHCNCCDGNFITFLPFGLVKRANASCPRCGSLERHRLHWHFMVNQTNLFKSSNVLHIFHVAPEAIFYRKFSDNPRFDYVPCAKFGEGYTDEYPAKTINVDITNIQFEDNSFDVIYCSHVLEHVPNDLQAMKEFHRVLKPGGWSMLQVPLDKSRIKTYEDFTITDPKEREQAFGQYDHVRVYGIDYIERLKLAGFKVDQINYTHEFNENEIFSNGFQKGEDIFICSK